MAAIQQASRKAAQERLIPVAQSLAEVAHSAGLSELEIKLFGKYAEFEAVVPANLLDYVKRRATKKEAWMSASQQFLAVLAGDVKSIAQGYSTDIVEQMPVYRDFANMIGVYLFSIQEMK